MAEVSRLQPQFPTLERQREADHFGMLIFLTTEVLIFGGVFAAAFVLRTQHSAEYIMASKEMHYWLGGLNTAVLLTSSALIALMVEAVKAGSARLAKWLLMGAIALGLAFLATKFTEYGLEYRAALCHVCRRVTSTAGHTNCSWTCTSSPPGCTRFMSPRG